MILRPVDVDGIRRGLVVGEVTPTAATLAAAVELACAVAARQATGDDSLRRDADRWLGAGTFWNDAISWLVDGRRPSPVARWSAPTLEAWGIETEHDITSDDWQLYQDRFRRAAVEHGFTSNLAAAISMAIAEMADNVYQHSGGARGLAVFQVADRAVHWCVGDIGRGVLGSLRACDRWTSLRTTQEALTAVWRDAATSRPDAAEGSGFRQVERSLASLHGWLRFRSGDAVLELSGATGVPQARLRSNPPLSGLQISVSCSIGKPSEIVPVST